MLLSTDANKIRENEEIMRQLTIYSEIKIKLDNNQQVQTFIISDQNGENAKMLEGLTSEYIFYDNLIDQMPKTDQLDHQLEFYEKLKSLHKGVFGKDVDVQQKVDHLTTSSFENVKQSNQQNTRNQAQVNSFKQNNIKPNPERQKDGASVDFERHSFEKDKISEDYDFEIKSKSNNLENKSARNDQNDRVGDMKFTLGMDNDRFENDFQEDFDRQKSKDVPRSYSGNRKQNPVVPERFEPKTSTKYKTSNVKQENQKLKSEIHELSILKEDLAQKIDQSFTQNRKNNTSMNFSTIKSNPEVQQLIVMKNQKEQDIDDLKKKIERLETSMHVDPVFETVQSDRKGIYHQSGNKTRSMILDEKSMSGNTRTFKAKKTYVKNTEKSGSTFVNQMMNDINKVLGRGNGGKSSSPNVSLSRSYYTNI